jgi:hypothetical protein
MKQITGQQITRLTPLGTQYHNRCIGVYDDKENYYLMKVDEILKFNTDFNRLVFNIVKKRVRSYLEVVEDKQ